MRIFRRISIPLLGPLVISGMLHAAAIVSFHGIGVLGITGLTSEKSLSADLLEEMRAKSHGSRAAKKYSGIYSPPCMSAKEGVRPEGKNEGDATAQDGPAADADVERAREATLPSDEKKAMGLEGLTDERDKKGAAKVAKYVLPEGAAISPKRSQTRIINFKREKFSYDVFWLGIYVGKAVLEAVNEGGIIRITSQVNSAPVISTIYKVEDYAESKIKEGRPFNFRIRQHEGKYRSNKEIIFDTDNGKVTYFDYLKGIKDEHLNPGGLLWDVISGFYYLRTRGLDRDKKVYIDIFDSNKVLNAEVNVLGRESINFAEKGEIEAVIVKPVLKSDGLFQNKGDIRIWLSNDERRMPLRVETRVSIGKVTAELKRVETE